MSFICIVCRELLSSNPRDSTGAASAVTAGARLSLEIVATKCGHLYHLVCLEDWFNKQTNPRQECPLCKAVLQTNGHQRIFPIGDEETDDIDAKLKKATEATQQSEVLKHEIKQFETVLGETGLKLEHEMLSLDILRYEYSQKVSELEDCQMQKKDIEMIVETMENNCSEAVNKLTQDKEILEKAIESMENQLITQQTAQDEQQQRLKEEGQACGELLQTIFMDTVK